MDNIGEIISFVSKVPICPLNDTNISDEAIRRSILKRCYDYLQTISEQVEKVYKSMANFMEEKGNNDLTKEFAQFSQEHKVKFDMLALSQEFLKYMSMADTGALVKMLEQRTQSTNNAWSKTFQAFANLKELKENHQGGWNTEWNRK